MPTKKDIAWLTNVGGRVMPKNGEGHEEKEKKPDLTDKIEEMHEKKLLFDAARDIFGSQGQPTQIAPSPAEALANTIVTQAMKDTQHLIAQLNLESASLRRDMMALQKDGVDTQTRLFAEMYGRIQDKQEGMDKTARDAAAAGAPPDAFASYFKVKSELDKIAPPQTAPQPQDVGNDVQLQITQMRLNHEVLLAQLQTDNARQDREWQIRLLEFQEETKRRWAEYADNKSFRQDGMAGLSDLVTSLSSGISRERGGDSGGPEAVAEANISQFPCTQCKTPITVTPGAVTAVCPNPECGVQYGIKEP